MRKKNRFLRILNFILKRKMRVSDLNKMRIGLAFLCLIFLFLFISGLTKPTVAMEDKSDFKSWRILAMIICALWAIGMKRKINGEKGTEPKVEDDPFWKRIK
jgi:hypothetical protein